MRFITNQSTPNHEQVIHQIFQEADEVFVAVAFLKKSGLSHFEKQINQLAKEEVPVTMVVGLNFAITEPDALARLLTLQKKYASFRLFICRLDKNSQAFHPKIYATRKEKRFQLLSGSANLTNGGLNTNHEASIFLEGTINSEIWKEVSTHFQFLTRNSISELINKDLLNEYTLFYEKARRKRGKNDFEFDTTPKAIDLNTQDINRYLTKEKRKELEKIFIKKEEKYQKALQILNQLAESESQSKEEFLSLYNQLVKTKGNTTHYLDSGGLHRHRQAAEKHYKTIIKIIKTIKDNQKLSAGAVFDLVLEIKKGKKGIGVNLIAEIMMTLNPNKFANINKNPITVLTEITGKQMKKTYAIYDGEDYQKFCDLVFEINRRVSFQNSIQTDAFCNEVYWPLKSRMKTQPK